MFPQQFNSYCISFIVYEKDFDSMQYQQPKQFTDKTKNGKCVHQ